MGILSSCISSWSNSYLNLWIYGQNSTDSGRTTRYDDGQSPRNRASRIQKLAFRCFLLTSAKAKKFQDGDRSIRHYTVISLQLRRFSKIATIVYQKDSRSFYSWVHQETKRSILQDYELTDRHTHTHTQTDCYNPPPTIGLKTFTLSISRFHTWFFFCERRWMAGLTLYTRVASLVAKYWIPVITSGHHSGHRMALEK